MANGRPCGVMLEGASSGSPTTSVTSIRQVEMPTLYAGDDPSATMQIQNQGGGYFMARVPSGATPPNLNFVQAGNMIQFNNQGPWYTIPLQYFNSGVVNLTNSTITLPYIRLVLTDPTQALSTPWPVSPPSSGTLLSPPPATPTPIAAGPVWSAPVPYCIKRLPYSSTYGSLLSTLTNTGFGGAAPLQLPAGSSIILSCSSIDDAAHYSGTSGTGFAGHGSVFIMFSPSGAIDRVAYGYGNCVPATWTTTNSNNGPVAALIFLLVAPSTASTPARDNIGW